MPNRPPSAKSKPIPSDICIVLCSFPGAHEDGWLRADHIRDRLARLGFVCTTPQVAAWLARLSRMEAPPIEVDRNEYGNGYRVTHFGETWIHNVLPDIWWAQHGVSDRLRRAA